MDFLAAMLTVVKNFVVTITVMQSSISYYFTQISKGFLVVRVTIMRNSITNNSRQIFMDFLKVQVTIRNSSQGLVKNSAHFIIKGYFHRTTTKSIQFPKH